MTNIILKRLRTFPHFSEHIRNCCVVCSRIIFSGNGNRIFFDFSEKAPCPGMPISWHLYIKYI